MAAGQAALCPGQDWRFLAGVRRFRRNTVGAGGGGQLAVSEFMFRNLSVKLSPAPANVPGDGAVPVQDAHHCSPCTHLCTATVVACCGCSAYQSITIVWDTKSPGTFYCDYTSNVCDPGYGFDTNFPGTGTDGLQQLAQLRSHLQRSMAVVDARQQEAENAARPKSVEEIDNLKSQLLAAVTELDEQRAQMTGGQPAPAP
jgi:hypothetical protein